MNPQAFSAIFGTPPGMATPEAMGVPRATPDSVTPGFPGGFAQLMHAQKASAAVMEELRAVLPVEEFAQLEAQVDGGNLLPLAEIVAALGGQQQQPQGDGAMSDGQPPLAQIVAMMRHGQDAGGLAEGLSDATQQSSQAIEEVGAIAELSLGAGDSKPMDADEVLPTAADADLEHMAAAPFTAGSLAAQGQPDQAQEPARLHPIILPQKAKALLNGGKQESVAQFMVDASADSETQPNAELEIEAIRQKFILEGMKTTEASAGHVPNPAASLAMLRRTLAATDGGGLMAPGFVAQGAHTQQMPQMVSTTAASTPLPIDLPPGHKGWDQAVGERMMWMIGNRVQAAEVRITPPHLGPIDIRISIQNDQANVSFLAQHAVVRDALEASIPRLREMLGDNNLQLANVDVGQRDASEQRGSAGFFFHHGSNSGYAGSGFMEDVESGLAEAAGARYYQSDGLLDAFA